MIRLLNAYFPKRALLLALSEASLIILCFLIPVVAYRGEDAELYLLYEQGLLRIGIAAGVVMLCMYYYDLYDSFVIRNSREVVTRLIQAFGMSCLILAGIYYMSPWLGVRTRVFLIGVFLVGSILFAWRKTLFSLMRFPRFADRVVLLGEGKLAQQLAWEAERRIELGLNVVGYVDSREVPAASMNGLPCLGKLEDLPDVVKREQVNRVIVTMGDRRGRLPVEQLLQMKAHGLMVQDGAHVYESVTGRLSIDALRLSSLVFSPGFGISRGMLLYKRTASIVMSLVGLVVSLPVMALIAVAIWLDSGGPIIFRQERVGQNGKLFTLYKFRSMRVGADGNGRVKPAQEHDDRFTRVGRILRRFRLDELPQLYNILRGDMSFVGPRPFARDEEEELAQKIPFYTLRWNVKPGATGWAQIHRGYCATLEDNIEKLSYDLFYVKNMSPGLDFLILFQTFKILLLGRGAR
jgi:sugar transferase (PEP-CTERM system associated)